LNKQGIYIAIINTLIGLGTSLLLKDNAVVACIITALIIGTILFIERAWLNEHLFRQKKHIALAAYSGLAITFLVGLFFVTEPMRKTSAIVARTTSFLNCIKSGNYNDAYTHISRASRQGYPLADFIRDHTTAHIKIQDFTIDQVTFNKFDDKKALIAVSSPFMLYDHATLNLELIKEEGAWRIVFSRKTVVTEPPSKSLKPPKTKRKNGAITNLFNSLF
jgi:hypothetical protein